MVQEFVQQVTNTIKNNIEGIHTCFPGTIIAFDPATGLASVKPDMKFKKPDGTTMDYPQITGVPVVFPQVMGQKATVALPVKSGDGCLVIVAEQSIDFWLYGQETDTDLSFDMTNSICIPGLFSKANPAVAEAVAQSAIIVDVNGSRLTVKSGVVQIDTKKVVINAADTVVNGNFTTNGGIVRLN